MAKPDHFMRLLVMTAAALTALLLLVVTAARPAGAAFPGKNGNIAFVRGVDNNSEIYVMDGDGSGRTRLTNNLDFDTLPAFSPDGRHVAFTSRRDSVGSQVNDEIYVMDAADRDGDGNGDNLVRLTNNPTADTFANFSPDGKKVAFTSRRDGNDELYVVSSDGTGAPIRLTNNPAVDEFPAFSPDGKQLAFDSSRSGNSEIYVMNSDGSGTPTRLTNNLVSDSKSDWGPLPDTTPPDITLTTPADGAAYTLGQQVNAEYSCQDEMGGSALASCVGTVPNGTPIDTATVGSKTFTVESTDNAGNTASKSHTYSVVYDFGGFFSPVDDPPTVNTIRAGRAIPVQFSLGGDQGLDI